MDDVRHLHILAKENQQEVRSSGVESGYDCRQLRAEPQVKGLKVTKLIFLPQNTTSYTQPMDQGIIKNLKNFYRNQVIVKQLDAAEKIEELSVTVLDAMRMLKQSWSMVTTRTIANCYRHGGFTTTIITEEEDPDDDLPLVTFACVNNINMEGYVNVDHDFLTCSELTDTDITDDLILARNSTKSLETEYNSNNHEPVLPPTTKQALDVYDLYFDPFSRL